MSIQQRLLKARYSEQNIRLSTNDFTSSGLYTVNQFHRKYRKQIEEVVDKSLKTILYPTVKDRYYKDNHKKITEDYIKYCYSKSKTNNRLIVNKLIIPLAYYIINNHRYNTYEHIGISITTGILQHMRKAIMRVMILNKELPLIFDRVNPASNGYYPLYKPMLVKTTADMRDKLYNIALPLAYEYIRFHKKYNPELKDIEV